jgi:tetratricopeptide (TPR) repeat protein
MKRGVLALALAICAAPALAQAGQSAQSAEAILAQARSLAANHQLAQANVLLSDLVRTDAENLPAFLELGRIQLVQGLNEDALKSFETVLAKEPNSAPARKGEVDAAINAALVERGIGENDYALIYLARARKFVPDSPKLLMDFGIQADGMHIYKDADEALVKAHELAPRDEQILYALAHVQADEGKASVAEPNLRAYLKIHPDDATAHYGLGHVLHMLSREDEAKAELERSITLLPNQAESWYELGEIAAEMQQDAEAKADYEKTLAVSPAHGGALTGMGELAYRAKDYASAEKYLQKALLYAPDYARAHQYYAMVLARMGRQEESERESALAKELREQQVKLSRGYSLTVLPEKD